MVVSPGSPHASWVDVVRHDVVVVGEQPMAECALPVLFDNLAIEQPPHLRVGAELPVREAPRIDLANLPPEPKQPYPHPAAKPPPSRLCLAMSRSSRGYLRLEPSATPIFRKQRWSKFEWMGIGSDRMLQNTNVPENSQGMGPRCL